MTLMMSLASKDLNQMISEKRQLKNEFDTYLAQAEKDKKSLREKVKTLEDEIAAMKIEFADFDAANKI